MKAKIAEKLVKGLEAPASGNRIIYDDLISGFGIRVTAAGSKAFVLNYVIGRRERRYTIGSYPAWTALAARKRAEELRREIDKGNDPLAKREADRSAQTVEELCDRFIKDELPKKRPSTRSHYERQIKTIINPEIGKVALEKLAFSDVDKLHSKVSARAPYQANRVVALLSRLFSLAIKWGLMVSNPAKGIERNVEHGRQRFLTEEEIGRLLDALDGHGDQKTANAIRLLILTGARKGETLSATWDQFDLGQGVWLKPGHATKQKRDHRLPLSDHAVDLLKAMKKDAGDETYLFPADRGETGHLSDIKKGWAKIAKKAGLEATRIHDLRHSFASLLVSGGSSLPMIGALLGHTQAATTARYAHLYDHTLREALKGVSTAFARKSAAKAA